MRKLLMTAFALLVGATSSSFAVEKLKVAVSQRGFWDSSWVQFGEEAGFFKEEGLEIEPFYTDGGAQTLTAVTSGSVDIGLSNGFLGAIGAYVKGAPIKVISAQMTGAHELFWWVKADSPYQSLKDVPEGKTIAFSSPGSSSNLILLGLMKQSGSKGKPLATGGVPGTFTQAMTGQIDVGWSVVPFGLPDASAGKIRIIARAGDLTEMKNQTIRVNLVNTEILKTRREAIVKFMRAYARSIDWAYGEGHAKAIEIFAQNMKVSPAVAKQGVDEFYPRDAVQFAEIKDVERTVKEALDYKFLAAAKTAKDIEGMFDIVYKPAK